MINLIPISVVYFNKRGSFICRALNSRVVLLCVLSPFLNSRRTFGFQFRLNSRISLYLQFLNEPIPYIHAGIMWSSSDNFGLTGSLPKIL